MKNRQIKSNMAFYVWILTLSIIGVSSMLTPTKKFVEIHSPFDPDNYLPCQALSSYGIADQQYVKLYCCPTIDPTNYPDCFTNGNNMYPTMMGDITCLGCKGYCIYGGKVHKYNIAETKDILCNDGVSKGFCKSDGTFDCPENLSPEYIEYFKGNKQPSTTPRPTTTTTARPTTTTTAAKTLLSKASLLI